MTEPALLVKPCGEGVRAPAAPTAQQAEDLSWLRLAFVSGNYNCLRDGANRAQNMLVRHLLDRGAKVRIYSPTCERPAFAPEGDLVSVPSSPLPFGRKEYRIAWSLPRVTRDDMVAFAPNLFHISLPLFHGWGALRLARRMGIPAIAAMHTRFETYPRYYRLGFMERPVLATLRHFYRGCDYVVAPSEPVAEVMREQGMGEDIGIWSRGVDTEAFHPKLRDEQWRKRSGFADGAPVIAFMGRLVREKGLDDFAAIIQLLRQRGQAFHILVIGDGPGRALFEQQLGDATFAGFQHGLPLARMLASADILVNPSSTEGFSNVSLEAMASGVPVIAANTLGMTNIISDGHSGMLVEDGTISGFAEAVQRYLADPVLRTAHAANARSDAECFSWDRANQAMADIYTRVFAACSAAKR